MATAAASASTMKRATLGALSLSTEIDEWGALGLAAAGFGATATLAGAGLGGEGLGATGAGFVATGFAGAAGLAGEVGALVGLPSASSCEEGAG